MFQFRFLKGDSHSDESTKTPEFSKCKWFEAKEVQPDIEFTKEVLKGVVVNSLRWPEGGEIKYVSSHVGTVFSKELKDCPFFKAERNNSDLLTGIYEGGLKIWECTYDLANYISEQHIHLQGKNVLDLGCGAGIIGLLAFVDDAYVWFQDYNEEIIKYVTLPNVYLNAEGRTLDACKFYAGDWSSFLTVTQAQCETECQKFDYIFTCETIYNPQNYKKLHTVFKERLKQTGVIYLAAKTHYFGVGGGLRQFEDFIVKENVFNVSTCWKCSHGLQREILRITFKQPNR